jgi:hypothetical protein
MRCKGERLRTRRAFLASTVGIIALPGAMLSAEDKPRSDETVRMVPPEGDGAKYWPRWRGPSGQGVVEPGGYLDKWSDTENVLWKVDLPGAGNSSPIIWNDRIFLTTSHDKGKKRSILCLNRADGKLLWETPGPGRHAGKDPAEERLRVRHAQHRRRADLGVFRQPRSGLR